jgi:hypothetical protein
MRRRRPEQALHRACAQFLDIALPSDACWFHPPNGGARSPVEAAIFKGLGVKAGVPDLVIVYRGRFIAIELKGPNGRLTPAQKAMHGRLQGAGAVVTTAKSLEELAGFLAQLIPLRASLGDQFRPGHNRPGRSTGRE